jgi:hypothetical protein
VISATDEFSEPNGYRRGGHSRHSVSLIDAAIAGPTWKRITPYEVEQKFLVPVLLEIGVPTTTNSLHTRSLHTALRLKLYPDF